MTCIKAQSMIMPFINNKLNIKEMEEFLDHIGSCPNCKEELVFYYALLTAMKQLDEDKNVTNDFRLALDGKIKRAQEKIIRVKYTYYRKITVLILFMILLAFLLGFQYAEKSIENVNNVTESNFHIRKSFRDERYDFLEKQLQEYLNQQEVDKMPLTDGE
ncbi:MAG: hypothetical protein PHF63_14285 [Herbinix sp.]|nr:hypothetical protein [Herbinix sp.]